MRWMSLLVAVALGLAGLAWGFPAVVLDLGTRALDAAGEADRIPDVVADFDLFRAFILENGPGLLLGAAALLLLAAVLMRSGTRGPAPEMEMLFDFASTNPKYVTADRWEGSTPDGKPLVGTAYRVGIRNRTRAPLPAVVVTIQVSNARPTVSRFARDKSYCADIAPRATELVEIFMMRDEDAATGARTTETVTVRASAPGARTVARTFRFDSAAKETLVAI